jgi:hypothetical protein
MFTALSLSLATLVAPATATPAPAPDEIIARWVRASSADRPRMTVWLDRDDVYQQGDRARVYFKSDRDAYVTILRIDTDGRMRILFPIDPWEDNWARGGKTFEVLGRDRDEAFRIDDYPGVGYIFGIASSDPFNYDDIVRGDHWDYRAISDGRVRGDPYVALSDFAERIARENDYDYDVAEYDVDRHYDYPRFVCYDCHSYTSWHYWDPYDSYCSRFRIVIYDDWYYYPYRRYHRGGVFVRPYRPGPRYVFKDANPRNDYITRVAERPRSGPGYQRPGGERDRTSADVGGRGVIPAPVSPRRRAADVGDRGRSSDNAGRDAAPRQPTAESRPESSNPRGEPRRRVNPDDGGTHGTVRELPPSSDRGTPRSRPSNTRPAEPAPSSTERGDRARSDGPSRRESPPATRRSPEPSREPARQAPPPERSRAEPRGQDAPRRGGGEPELRRRPH